MAERFCGNCGHELSPEDRFCPNCGRPAHETAQVPTPEADVDVAPPLSPGTRPGTWQTEMPQGEAPREGWSWNRRILVGCLAIFGVFFLLIVAVAALIGGGEETAGGEGGGGEGQGGGEAASEGLGFGASRQKFTNNNYAELFSDPNAYKGATVDVTGQLLERPDVSGDELAFQMFADAENADWNTVVYTEDTNLDLDSDDYVRVKGEVLGIFEGENAFGGMIEAPMIQASDVQPVSAGQALDPARKVLNVNQTSSDQGFYITLRKIEFGEESTRAYVTITNDTGRGASFYTFDMKIQQGSRQIDYLEDSFSYYDEEPQSELRPGIKTEGVIPFGPVDPDQPFEIILPWSSNNWNVNSRPVTFQINP